MCVLSHLCFDQPPKLPGRITVPSFTWEGSSWVRLPTQGFGDEEKASPKRFPTRFLGKSQGSTCRSLEITGARLCGAHSSDFQDAPVAGRVGLPLCTQPSPQPWPCWGGMLDRTLHFCPGVTLIGFNPYGPAGLCPPGTADLPRQSSALPLDNPAPEHNV